MLLVSGLLGFRIGMVGFPDWQVAVETSQVIAGLVKYPAGNPFFIYHVKLWTVLHQMLAPFLLLGVSEIRLSLVISGVLGMVTFQALSMVVYALSRDAWLAIGAAAFIFFTRAAEYGGVYGLFLLGTENTYGILGMSFCLLAVACIGAGAYRSGAFLLAVAPAVHPSLGVWTGAIVACALLFDVRALRAELRPARWWFFIGCTVTLISLALQLVVIYRAPHAPPTGDTFTTPELSAFIRFWDGHRKPVDITNDGVSLNFGALAMAAIWLLAFKDDLPRPSLFLLRFVLVSALLSIALIFVSWIPPDRLPATLLILMPGRLLNFDALVYVAMLIGLLGAYRRWWSHGLLLLLAAGVLVGDHSMLWEWLQEKRGLDAYSTIRPLWIVTAASVALVVGAAWEKKRGRESFSAATAEEKDSRPLVPPVRRDCDAAAHHIHDAGICPAARAAVPRSHQRRVLRAGRRRQRHAADRRGSASHSVENAAAGAAGWRRPGRRDVLAGRRAGDEADPARGVRRRSAQPAGRGARRRPDSAARHENNLGKLFAGQMARPRTRVSRDAGPYVP